MNHDRLKSRENYILKVNRKENCVKSRKAFDGLQISMNYVLAYIIPSIIHCYLPSIFEYC